ncbi:type II toxin-antitoxin system VapC family toxin [Candidatus Micrarchaeota archaeon]|nr:type II toxin-antitoxin system VapC family toxin [Candidatus Micrarchaeota archaeon]
MIIVDSSFLIAFFHDQDSQHEKALSDMRGYDEQKEDFLITEHVLGEAATVLLYYKGLPSAETFLDFTEQKCKIKNLSNDDFQATLHTFKNQKNEISYIDASVVYLAKFLQLPVACYDENILKEINRK